MAKNIFRIPNFIAAPTKDMLVKKMLANNMAHVKEFEYFDIQKEGSNWVAWYYFAVRDANGDEQSSNAQ